jgi:putative ABC transport system permease protein
VTEIRAALASQGPALAVFFYALVGVLALLLAAGALILAVTVDRARRVEDLAALRSQGLTRSDLRRAVLGTYPALVLAATLAGTAIALLGWGLTGWALPFGATVPVPGWPSAGTVAGTAGVAAAALTAVAAAAAHRTLRRIP